MSAACFAITGTDTGVGKTFVACGLARELRRRGFDVGVSKPFCCGSREDAQLLIAASACGDTLATVNPCYFAAPLAPYRAAQMAGVSVDLAACFAALDEVRQRHALTLIEGAGGLLVPLCETDAGVYSMCDFFADAAAEVVIVARRGLGTINHTWLSVAAARAAGLTVAGIVFCDAQPQEPGEPGASNPEVTAHCTGARVLGVIPHCPPESVWRAVADGLFTSADE